MGIIEKRIKEIYSSKANFSETIGINPKDYASKFKTVKNQIDFVNEFLNHLKLKIRIVEISDDLNKAEADKK